VGTFLSGWVVDYFTTAGIRDWHNIWFTFAGYALLLSVSFPLVFRYRHTETNVAN